MTEKIKSSTSSLLNLKKHHPAWQLLTAHTGPLMLGSLRRLFSEKLDGIDIDAALPLLNEALKRSHEAGDIELDEVYLQLARSKIHHPATIR